jgi:hypothetical protein
MQNHFYSASVRSEMKALDMRNRRLPFGTMLVSVIVGANTASLLATLISF